MPSPQELVDIEKEQQRLALEEKKRKEQEALTAYETGAGTAIEQGKTGALDVLGQRKSEIEGLYNKGREDLQNLYGEQSKYAMEQSVRDQEKMLARKGLTGGPSGALNEALAGAAERVRQVGLEKTGAYDANRLAALDKLYQSISGEKMDLTKQGTAYELSKLDRALGLENASAAEIAAAAQNLGTKGLEAGLGLNVIKLQQEGAKDLATTEGQIQIDIETAKAALEAKQLKEAQSKWDRDYSSLKQSLYDSYRRGGMMDGQATEYAEREARRQLGTRP